ncbi:MAG: DivIVA domain-containing protein [Clostridia bacterium]|nr:DivIVA domain-containing protein [Clostridia bacterium]MBR6783461.1 DivIVA domain-containing protein [Clostridia bacterium]
MLAPHELKNKQFQKTFKGYNPQEVDEYLEFVLEKYTELYRENNELERKLRIVVTNLDEIKDEEESIRSTLISAQKMAEKIIADANDRADIITGAIKDRCDGVIAEFRQQLQAEKEKAWIMRTRIIDFKKSVYELYGKHIAELKDLSVNEIEDIVLPNEDALIAGIFTDVKGRIEEETERRKNARELKNEEPPYSDIAEDDSNAQEIATAVAGASPELSPEAQEAEDEYLKYMMGESEEEEESEE